MSDHSAPGTPEYLEAGAGSPIPPAPPAGPTRSGSRKGLLIAGGVALLAIVGVGAWAAASFLKTGAQPAEALPAGTLGYASVDLDPSGSQKLEALRTLNKFPAFKDELGLDADDDIREWLFDEMTKDSGCDLDYEDDIEPWLGERMAVAGVVVNDKPAPVVVVQVHDGDKAEAGLTKLSQCGENASDEVAWVIQDDWAVLAESKDIAQQVVDATEQGSLADDETFQDVTGAAGDAGIVAMYAAPEAAKYLADLADEADAVAGGGLSGLTGTTLEDGADRPEAELLKEFQGLAVTVRFDDGALEVESATPAGSIGTALYGSDRGGDVIETLPDDTLAAIGAGFEEGWLSTLVEQAASYAGEEVSTEDIFREASEASGLDLPADAETLLGDSAALSLGGDFDPEALINSSDVSGLPVALKVKGDPDAIVEVLEKLSGMDPTLAEMLGHDADGDTIVIGPDADYRKRALEHGSLGSNDVYRDVVRESGKAAGVFFVNFNAGDDWLVDLAGDDPSVAENLEPLAGFGISGWQDGDYAHGVIRLTTD